MRRHPPDRPALERWLAVVKAAKWKRFVGIRSTFASVDRVTAGSGRPVFVFNITGHRLTKDQEDYLEAISTFIEQYENKADPKPKKKTPAHEILRYLCQENGMSGAGLGRLLEVDRTLATRILRGERTLTVSQIQKICKRFKLSAERFFAR